MSSNQKKTCIGLLSIGLVAGFLATVKWSADLRPTLAIVPPDPPVVSIMFVVDSSESMFPRFGENYFDLAIEGIAEFISLPGLFEDGSYEIGVVQFSEISADINGDYWISPTVIREPPGSDETNKAQLVADVLALERTRHFSGSLMEIGIRDATAQLVASAATEKHIILLTTGEYRLPPPCPPPCYSHPSGCPTEGWDCDDPSAECFSGAEEPGFGFCNRTCHIRYFTQQAKAAGIRVSTLRMGPTWKNIFPCGDDHLAYQAVPDGPFNFCTPDPIPTAPERDQFMQELAACCPPCTPATAGRTERLNPFLCFDTEECDPGTAEDIAEIIAAWFCDLAPLDDDLDLVPNLCDNCPAACNPRQRDCDQDGIGDICQFYQAQLDCDPDEHDNIVRLACQPSPPDQDCDGIPNEWDICEGGDDCLVTEALLDFGCDLSSADPFACDCDCDHDGEIDSCAAAMALRDTMLPDPNDINFDTWAEFDADKNGIADACETGQTVCDAIPAFCEVPSVGDWVESFETYPGGDVAAWLAGRGWWINPSNAQDGVSIINGATGKDLVLGKSTTTSAEWFVEGPGLHLPSPSCAKDVCPTPDMSNWGAYSIDINLVVSNNGGTLYELFIMDPCLETQADAERIHLWFEDDPDSTADGGLIKIQRRWPDFFGSDRDVIGAYVHDTQFNLQLMINTGILYGARECGWTGDSKTVRIHGAASGFRMDELGHIEPGIARGVQLFLQTDNSGTAADAMKLGGVTLRQINQCEWFNSGCSAEDHCCCSFITGVGSNWSCSPSMGGCGNDELDPGEECEPPGTEHCDCDCQWSCGDGVVQGPTGFRLGGGMVIPLDTDLQPGVSQVSDVCSPLGATWCGPGKEQCDGFWDPDVPCPSGSMCGCDCAPTCQALLNRVCIDCLNPVCGDGILCLCSDAGLVACSGITDPDERAACELACEECDDGNTDPGDGCDENCKIEGPPR